MLSDALKAMKISKAMTMDDIAEVSGVPKSTIAKIFSGVTKDPSLIAVARIVHAMDYTLDDIETFDNDSLQSVILNKNTCVCNDPEKQRLLDNYNALNQIGRERLIAFSQDMVDSGNYITDHTASVSTDKLSEQHAKMILDYFDKDSRCGHAIAKGGDTITTEPMDENMAEQLHSLIEKYANNMYSPTIKKKKG